MLETFTHICKNIIFPFPGLTFKNAISGPCESCMLNFIGNGEIIFQSGHGTLAPVIYDGGGFFAPSLALVLLLFFYFSHSDRCLVISHSGFNLYFPNGQGC